MYASTQIKHFWLFSEIEQPVKMKLFCECGRKICLITANEKWRFLSKSSCFHLNKTLSSIRLE